MTTTLRTLLDRVEKGEGRDEELDVRLVAAFFAPNDAQVMQSPINGVWCIFDGTDRNGRPRIWEKRPLGYQPSPTSSIDAAVALADKVLPGYDHGYNTSDGIAFGTVWRAGYLDDTVVRGEARTPARAILAATLRAKIAQEGEEAYWSAPKDEDRCTAMAAAYRAMRAAAKADAPDPHVLQDRLHGMLRMAVASEDSFNRLSPAGRRLIQAAEGFFASSREDRDDLNACWDALQAETKRADAAEARLAALLRAKIAQEERA